MQPLTIFDGAAIGATLATTAIIGYHFRQKRQSKKEQPEQRQGDGKTGLLLAAASLAGTFVNPPTLIGFPTELYLNGPPFALAQLVAATLSWPLQSFLLLPAFKRHAGAARPALLQFLEARYSPRLRRLITLALLLMNTLYQACALLVPGLALAHLLGWPQTISLALVASLAALHSLAGLGATTSAGSHWLTLFQASIMSLLMMTVLAGGLARGGGLVEVWETNVAGGRLNLGQTNFLRLDQQSLHTIFNTVLGLTLLRTFLHGINPAQVETALSLPNLVQSRLSQLLATILFILAQLLATSIGLVFYSQFKDCDPLLGGQIRRRELTLMHYIQNELNFIPAIRGIFIASTLSSTLTTMSAYLTSSANTILNEIILPLMALTNRKTKGTTLCLEGAKKVIILLLATLCTIITVYAVDKTNNLLKIIFTLFGVYSGPIVACVLVSLLTTYVDSLAMICGCLVSLTLGTCVQFYQAFLMPHPKPSLPISADTCQLRWNNGIVSIKLRDTQDQFGDWWWLNISYFWLPFFLAMVTILVALTISVSTRLITKTLILAKARLFAFLHLAGGTREPPTICQK